MTSISRRLKKAKKTKIKAPEMGDRGVRCANSTFYFLKNAYLACCGVLQEERYHLRSPLKTVHRTVFLTGCFESLSAKIKAPEMGDSGVRCADSTFYFLKNAYLACCGVLQEERYHLRSPLKTVHRTVFLTGRFESLSAKIKAPEMGAFIFGAPTGTRTPDRPVMSR